MAVTGISERGAIIQREMTQTVAKFRPQKARTLATFEEGRKKQGRLAGIQIPYIRGYAHGQTWNNVFVGDVSYKKAIKETTGAMFAGVAFRSMNMYMNKDILRDMERGYIPDSYIAERGRRIATHMMKKNWAAIGDGTGSIAVVASCAAGVLTCTADNTARGRSKGSFRLKPTTADDPLLYDAVNPTTDAVVATFYVTSKPSGTQANVVFTFGDATALNSPGLRICEKDSWKKEMLGIGAHISDANRIYQGVDTSTDDFLKNPAIDAGNAAVTPTAFASAKGVAQTRGNMDSQDGIDWICHLTPGNYNTLARFGYTARQYQINSGSKGKVTYGLPSVYEEEGVMFVPDADYEDGYIDLRPKDEYFEYVQKEFGLTKVDGIGRHEWTGQYQVGSRDVYENYDENVNIVWDARGKDGKDDSAGSPGRGVTIKNIAIQQENQVNFGL